MCLYMTVLNIILDWLRLLDPEKVQNTQFPQVHTH
jgi:hypothetical protein